MNPIDPVQGWIKRLILMHLRHLKGPWSLLQVVNLYYGPLPNHPEEPKLLMDFHLKFAGKSKMVGKKTNMKSLLETCKDHTVNTDNPKIQGK